MIKFVKYNKNNPYWLIWITEIPGLFHSLLVVLSFGLLTSKTWWAMDAAMWKQNYLLKKKIKEHRNKIQRNINNPMTREEYTEKFGEDNINFGCGLPPYDPELPNNINNCCGGHDKKCKFAKDQAPEITDFSGFKPWNETPKE